MKKVLVFGTFDIVHPGHFYVFKNAKEYGDHLTVVVARDLTVKKVKGRLPRISQQNRLNNIKELQIVDEAVLGKELNVYDIIKEINPDVICLGYDQKSFTENLQDNLIKMRLNPKVIRLRPFRPDIYKSSKMATQKD